MMRMKGLRDIPRRNVGEGKLGMGEGMVSPKGHLLECRVARGPPLGCDQRLHFEHWK